MMHTCSHQGKVLLDTSGQYVGRAADAPGAYPSCHCWTIFLVFQTWQDTSGAHHGVSAFPQSICIHIDCSAVYLTAGLTQALRQHHPRPDSQGSAGLPWYSTCPWRFQEAQNRHLIEDLPSYVIFLYSFKSGFGALSDPSYNCSF